MGSVVAATTGGAVGSLLGNGGKEASKLLGIGKPYAPNANNFTPNEQEQEYISKLQEMAYGQAPSAAQKQLQAGLGHATAQSQALAASQRGISPALAARLGAMSQAGMLQQTNQDAGIMRAQEQQNAMGMLGNEMQSVRTGQMGLANLQSNAAEANQQRRTGFYGGLLKGASGMFAGGGGGMYNGGMVASPDVGGDYGSFAGNENAVGAGGMSSGMRQKLSVAFGGMGQSMMNSSGGMSPQSTMPNIMTIQSQPMGMSRAGQYMNRGGFYDGGIIDVTPGGKVPGRAEVAGDSPKNDTVITKTSPGEIVIPRTIVNGPNAPEAAAEFVRKELSKKATDKPGYYDGGAMPDTSALAQSLAQYSQPMQLPGAQPNVMMPDQAISHGGSWLMQPTFDQPAAAPVAQAPVANVPAAAPVQAAQSAPQMQMPMGNSGAGFGTMMQGIRDEAKAQGDLGKAQAQVMADQEKQLAQLNYDQEQLRWNYDIDSQKLADEAANGKVDPNHFLDSQTTGQRVMTSIGLLLGGIGSGMVGGENPALQFINNQIDRDIQGQIQNMGQKNNLLRANMEMFKNKTDAINMTKANLLNITQTKLQQEAAKSQDPMAQARAKQALGPLEQQRQALIGQTAQRQAILQGQGGKPSPEMVINYLIPKEDKDQATKELGELKDIQTKMGRVNEILDKQFELQKAGSRMGSPLQSNKLLDKAVGDLFPIIKSIVGEKMTKEDVEEMVKTNLIGFTDNKETKEAKKQELINSLMSAVPGRTPTLARYGQMFGVDMTKVDRPASVVERKTQDGKTALFDANSKKFLGYK